MAQSNNRTDAQRTARRRFGVAPIEVTEDQTHRVRALGIEFQSLGSVIDELVPPGRQKSLALSALEEAQLRVNQGILRPDHTPYPDSYEPTTEWKNPENRA